VHFGHTCTPCQQNAISILKHEASCHDTAGVYRQLTQYSCQTSGMALWWSRPTGVIKSAHSLTTTCPNPSSNLTYIFIPTTHLPSFTSTSPMVAMLSYRADEILLSAEQTNILTPGACPTAHWSTFLSHFSGPISCWTTFV